MTEIAILVGGLGDSELSLQPLTERLTGEGYTVHVLCPDVTSFYGRVMKVVNLVYERVQDGEPYLLVGQSAGGLAVLLSAQQLCWYGRAPSAAIALVPAPARGWFTSPLLHLPLLWNLWPYLRVLVRGTDFVLAEEHYRDLILNGVPAHTAAELLTVRKKVSGREAYELAMPWRQPRIAGPIGCPVLVVGARHDRIVAPWLHRLLVRRLERMGTLAALMMVEGGHMTLHQEGAPELLNNIQDWITHPDACVVV